MRTSKQIEAARRMTCRAFTVTHYLPYHDGFTLMVATELEAYRAAHAWQGAERTEVVHEAVHEADSGWVVRVFDQGAADLYKESTPGVRVQAD